MTVRSALFFFLLMAVGCACPPTRLAAPEPPATSSPTSVQRNFTYVDGTVDSVLAPGTEQLQLLVTIGAARAGSAPASILEAGTQITVAPEGRAMTFSRAAKRGDAFTGSVARSDAGWILLDAEAR